MEELSVKQRIENIVKDIMEIDELEDKKFSELKMDEFDWVGLANKVDQEFNIFSNLTDIKECQTALDVAKLVMATKKTSKVA